MLGKRIGGIKRLMDGGTRRVVGIAARDGLVLRDFCGYCLGSGWCVRHDLKGMSEGRLKTECFFRDLGFKLLAL